MAISNPVINKKTLRTNGEPPLIAILEPSVEPSTFEIASAMPTPQRIAPCFAKIIIAARLVATLVNFAIADEHLLPLMVALGASANDEVPFVFDGPIYYGMLSMESYFWGVSD